VVVRGEAERCNEEVAPLVSQSRGELNLGMGTAYTGGGLVHVLLVIAGYCRRVPVSWGPPDRLTTHRCLRSRALQEDGVRSAERSRRQDNDESPASRSR
jgi:hypothetical protein